MREIKFRAWDRERKTMFFDTIAGIPSDPIWKGQVFIGCEGYFEGELMQFTGLKDANGTDIYEGDLVTHSWAKDSAITPVEVRYKAPRFYLERTSNERQYAGVEIGAASEWVIVGNIYENPELVELPATRVTGS